jgi:hypothetical protein
LGKKESLTETGCSKETRTTWPLLAALVLIVLLAGGSCGGAASEQRAKETAEDEQASVVAGAGLGHPSLGEEGAPVVITEYVDYQ